MVHRCTPQGCKLIGVPTSCSVEGNSKTAIEVRIDATAYISLYTVDNSVATIDKDHDNVHGP